MLIELLLLSLHISLIEGKQIPLVIFYIEVI